MLPDNINNVLNYPTERLYDQQLLSDSYETLNDRWPSRVVVEGAEANPLFDLIKREIDLPPQCVLSLANLFFVIDGARRLYIAQCLQDFRFSVKDRSPIKFNYNYITVGFAELDSDYGQVLIRPETLADRLSGVFKKTDIDVADASEFNRKYYVAATDKESAMKLVKKGLATVIGNLDGFQMRVKGKHVFAQIENEMRPEHGCHIADVLSEL